MGDKLDLLIIGTGVMGKGLAEAAASASLRTHLLSRTEAGAEQARNAVLKRMQRLASQGRLPTEVAEAAPDMLSADADLERWVPQASIIVEAVPEQLDLKQELFARLAPLAQDDAVLASNTSQFAIRGIADGLPNNGRVLGLHFFNPVPKMALVEVVVPDTTAPATLSKALAFCRQLGKEPVQVKDQPGFVTSRAFVTAILEGIRILEDEVAEPESIDQAIRLGLGYPMGPLQLADLVGLDTVLFASDQLEKAYGERFRAPERLRQMVAEGHLGRKSGRGFYSYEEAHTA